MGVCRSYRRLGLISQLPLAWLRASSGGHLRTEPTERRLLSGTLTRSLCFQLKKINKFNLKTQMEVEFKTNAATRLISLERYSL